MEDNFYQRDEEKDSLGFLDSHLVSVSSVELETDSKDNNLSHTEKAPITT